MTDLVKLLHKHRLNLMVWPKKNEVSNGIYARVIELILTKTCEKSVCKIVQKKSRKETKSTVNTKFWQCWVLYLIMYSLYGNFFYDKRGLTIIIKIIWYS